MEYNRKKQSLKVSPTLHTKPRRSLKVVTIQVFAEVVPPRPPTSLLSLSDDLLYLVFKEIHEQRYKDTKPVESLRVSEILVNKRIFAIARPLWFSRLTITKSQLDRTISGLLKSDNRCRDLRRLEIPLVDVVALLTETIIARLPYLTHLSLIVPRGGSKLVHDTLYRIIDSTLTLSRFKLDLCGYADSAYSTVLERFPDPTPHPSRFRSQDRYRDGRLQGNATVQDGLRRNGYFHDAPAAYRRLPWKSLGYFRCSCREAETPSELDAFLEGLTAALAKDEVHSLVVL